MTRGLCRTGCTTFLITALQTLAIAEPLSVVDSRRVAIEFRSCDSAIEQAEVWQTRDEGRTWEAARVERIERSAVIVAADRDGRVGFCIVVRNAAGMSALPPIAGQSPQVSVLVDTQSPTLQLHGVRVAWSDGAARLMLHATLAEENIDAAAVRAFARPSGDDATAWRDLGPIRIEAGRAVLALAGDLCEAKRIDVCVSATDLAGNRSCERVIDVPIPAQPIVPVALAQPSMSAAGVASAEGAAGTVSAVALPVLDDRNAGPSPLPPDAPSTRDSRAAIAELSPEQMRRVSELRHSAAAFAGRGEWNLAAARFEDAARIAPDLVDVQLDLGQALMNTNRLEDAVKKFKGVISQQPDHAAALESLALVTAAQRNYPSARTHLKRLTELQPDSASHWLRYGDVEFKLGNRADAHAAWDRAIGLSQPEDAVRQRAQQRLRDLSQPTASRVERKRAG
ncbi:MAG: tetratricopeptide repeat protein [Phycisphaerae bacterium]